MNLALFDFDGTLTCKDSLSEFLKHSVTREKYLLNMFKFLPYFILYKLKLLRNDISKQKLFEIFFKGMDEKQFNSIATNYSLIKLDSIIDKDRIEMLHNHQENGDRVVIVSASMQSWLQPWCDKNNIELLSTQLEFKDAKVTGKFSTENCYGIEKARRVKQLLHVEDYETIFAYGDSAGDTQMLEIADKATLFNT
ncbi:haloacid dehalogenase-like hydrolase [Sulfurimonas sp.]|nr:haloacid dehalogenase-like hydrolase [Sulfurimonas sp.]